MNARQKGSYYLSQGYDIRYGHGYYKDTRHMWCEYRRDNEWVMAKDTIGYVDGGYPVEDYGGYTVTWYGTNEGKGCCLVLYTNSTNSIRGSDYVFLIQES